MARHYHQQITARLHRFLQVSFHNQSVRKSNSGQKFMVSAVSVKARHMLCIMSPQDDIRAIARQRDRQ
ncbi:Uncharacterised protein [Vibrio cholerae]|nr:Uncharacterised protein [Vibrio cholerae]